MLLKARCGRFAFACTFVFPTKRFKFARIKSIDNEALLRQLVQSSQKKVPLFFTTDRLVQILDFGDVSTDRQALSRVTRKVLSNSKHTLLCLCGHNVLERMLVQGGVLLVESSEQGLVFGAYALIGVSHHFSGNERLTVGKSLVMLGDLKAFLLL